MRNIVWVVVVCLLLVVVAPTTTSTVVVEAKNMIDGTYHVANVRTDVNNDHDAYSTVYKSEYFDVYSPPIKSVYSQVFWADMGSVPLPQHIIDRFTNKTMAIVGYEVDQVQKINDNSDDDIPVPITHAYNHHYMASIYDSRTGRMVRKSTPKGFQPGAIMTHGMNTLMDFEYHDTDDEQVQDHDDDDDDTKNRRLTMMDEDHNNHNSDVSGCKHKRKYPSQFIPPAQIFSEGNGGEMRLSYHGYPKGYAQLLNSPDRFQITPMQIDVWNRDVGSSPKFKPGPMPKTAEAPREGEEATYSGLLECPCSDRLERKIWDHYQLLPAPESKKNCHSSLSDDPIEAKTPSLPTCVPSDIIRNVTECFHAAQYVVPSQNIIHHIVEPYDSTLAQGCSLIAHSTGVVDVYWNEKKEDDYAEDTTPHVVEEKVVVGTSHQDNQDQTMMKRQEVVAFGSSTINATVTLTSVSSSQSSESVPENSNKVDEKAVITLVGPKDVWFGIGWGTSNMCRDQMDGDECPSTGPYSIIVTGDHVEERLLDYHGIGHVLESSTQFMSVVSNTVDGDFRTVTVERPLKGLDERYFSFKMDMKSINVITATGCSMTLAQHCSHGTTKLNFIATDTQRTVCRDGELASIGGRIFSEGKRCAPFPKSTLMQQHNPTCSARTYSGGQHCCHHLLSLLDTDQEIPWQDQPLEYHLKFRFYFEEYIPPKKKEEEIPPVSKHLETTSSSSTIPPSHKHLVRLYWMTEAFAGEYDIIQCPPGTPRDQCVQVITSQFSVTDMLNDCDGTWCTGEGSRSADGIELIYAGPHCHAPSCLSMELYNADTGELLCHVKPRPGTSTDAVYDELGFLAIPPCLWGEKEDGLVDPVFLPLNTTLLSIKRNNNTLPHYGEMASWQMRGVVVNKNVMGWKEEDEQKMSSSDQHPTDTVSDSIEHPMMNEEEDRTLKIRRRERPDA